MEGRNFKDNLQGLLADSARKTMHAKLSEPKLPAKKDSEPTGYDHKEDEHWPELQ